MLCWHRLAHTFALYVSVRLPELPSGSSSGLPLDPTFGSVARCPDRRKLLLCLLLLLKSMVPWPSCCLKISYISPRAAAPCSCSTWSPILIPRPPWKWPGRLLSPASVVSMKVRNILVGLLAMSGSSAPSRTTASGRSAVNFGFTTFCEGSVLSQSASQVTSWICAGFRLAEKWCKTGGVEDKGGVPVWCRR